MQPMQYPQQPIAPGQYPQQPMMGPGQYPQQPMQGQPQSKRVSETTIVGFCAGCGIGFLAVDAACAGCRSLHSFRDFVTTGIVALFVGLVGAVLGSVVGLSRNK